MKEEKSQLIVQEYKKPVEEYYQQLNANAFDNWKEMDKLLET